MYMYVWPVYDGTKVHCSRCSFGIKLNDTCMYMTTCTCIYSYHKMACSVLVRNPSVIIIFQLKGRLLPKYVYLTNGLSLSSSYSTIGHMVSYSIMSLSTMHLSSCSNELTLCNYNISFPFGLIE